MRNIRNYLEGKPTAAISLLFILLIAIIFFYQLFRPIDVLENWHIELAPVKEYRVIDGRRLAVFHPNETLIFTSTSSKIAHASGQTNRTLVCEPTTELDEREILLDIIPATKDIGESPERASSIILPDVIQFNRLPRICRLVIDITYTNVALWRNHSEHAETEAFIVEELNLTPKQMREEIERLNRQINELEERLGVTPTNESEQIGQTPQQSQAPSQPSQHTAQQPTQQPTQPEPSVEAPAERGIVQGLINTADNVINGLLGR